MTLTIQISPRFSAPSRVRYESDMEAATSPPKTKKMRHPQLDMIRTACALWVGAVHLYPASYAHNPCFVANWVMQYLCLISGVSFAMSQRPVRVYCKRLLYLAAIGMTLNTIPIVCRLYKGMYLMQAPLVVGVIWQFWYIIVLLFAIAAIYPLRIALETNTEMLYMRVSAAWLILFGLCAACMFMQIEFIPEEYYDVFGINDSFLFLAHTFGFLLVATVGMYKATSHTRHNEQTEGSILGWILIAYTHSLSVIMTVRRAGQFCYFFQLIVIGFVLYHAPLRGRTTLQRVVKDFWILIVFLLQYFIDRVECDILQLSEMPFVQRICLHTTSACFALFFAALFCPFAEEKEGLVGGKIAPSWKLGNNSAGICSKWALGVYLGHYAVLDFIRQLVTERELGNLILVILFGCPLVFVLYRSVRTKQL